MRSVAARPVNRLRRLGGSISATVLAQFASLISPLLVFPAMLRHLGPEDFGVWVAAIAFANIALVLDFGIGSAILTKVSESNSRGDTRAISRYMIAAYGVLSGVSLLGFVLIGALSYGGVGAWFPTSNGWPIAAAVMFACLLNLPLTITYRVLYALQRIPLQSSLQVSGAALAVSVTLISIHASAYPWAVVLLHALAPTAVMLATTVWFFLRHPHLGLERNTDVSTERRALFQLGSRFFALSILTAIGTNADLLLVSGLAGPEIAAMVAPSMRIGSVLLVLVINVYLPLWAFNGEALARGEFGWVRRNTIIMSIGGAILVGLAGGVALLLLDSVMYVWMGKSFEGQSIVLAGMVLFAVATAITAPFNMVLNAAGRASAQVVPWAAFVLISLILKALLINEGAVVFVPALGALVYFLAVTPFMIREAAKVLGAGQSK